MPTPNVTLLTRLADLVLTTEPAQRIRLAQAGLAMMFMTVGVIGMGYFAWIGVASPVHVGWLALGSIGGLLGAYGLIRSGWSRRFRDPALTLPQMAYALACGAAAYAVAGSGRGAVFPIVMVCLMFGMFQLRQRQMAAISLLALVLLGAAMALMASIDPGVYDPAIEFGHFLMVGTMVPAASYLAAQLSRLRRRLREQKDQIAQALARIEILATRDELTALINRRHMQELMERERLRAERSGKAYCVGLIDIDHFKAVNDGYGHAGGDEVLRRLAHAMESFKRGTDVLARWGGEEFVLLMPETSIPAARAGIERLRRHVEALTLDIGGHAVQITLSGGVAEFRQGETIAQVVERADHALYAAKKAGRNCVTLA